MQVVYKDETIWATQKAMAALFEVDRSVITKHLKHIFDANELQQDSVCAFFAHTAEDGKIVKPDVSIAKNYLNEEELEDMGRLVNATLNMAERMAQRHIPMTMEDWSKRIDAILKAGGDAILSDAGKISADYAKDFAESEFEKYRIIQDRLFASDFDKFNSANLLPPDIDLED